MNDQAQSCENILKQVTTPTGGIGLESTAGFRYTKSEASQGTKPWYAWRCTRRTNSKCPAFFYTDRKMEKFTLRCNLHNCAIGNIDTALSSSSVHMKGPNQSTSSKPSVGSRELSKLCIQPKIRQLSQKRIGGMKQQRRITTKDDPKKQDAHISAQKESVELIVTDRGVRINTQTFPLKCQNCGNDAVLTTLCECHCSAQEYLSALMARSHQDGGMTTNQQEVSYYMNSEMREFCTETNDQVAQLLKSKKDHYLVDFATTTFFDVNKAAIIDNSDLPTLIHRKNIVDSLICKPISMERLAYQFPLQTIKKETLMRWQLDVDLIFIGKQTLMVYFREKVTYSSDIRARLQGLLHLLALNNWTLHNIDIAIDFNCTFQLSDPSTFIDYVKTHIPTQFISCQITADAHSLTLEQMGKTKIKVYEKVTELLLVSSAKQKIGGIHRFLASLKNGFIQEQFNGVTRIENSFYGHLPLPEEAQSAMLGLNELIDLCTDDFYKVSPLTIWHGFWNSIKEALIFFTPEYFMIIYGRNNYQNNRMEKLVGYRIKTTQFSDDMCWVLTRQFLPYHVTGHCFIVYSQDCIDEYEVKQNQPIRIKLSARYDPLAYLPQCEPFQLSEVYSIEPHTAFEIRRDIFNWRSVPIKQAKKALSILAVEVGGDKDREKSLKIELLSKVRKIDKQMRIIEGAEPLDYRVDGASISHFKGRLTLFDVQQRAKYQIDALDDEEIARALWSKLEKIYWDIHFEYGPDGNSINTTTVSFHPLMRPRLEVESDGTLLFFDQPITVEPEPISLIQQEPIKIQNGNERQALTQEIPLLPFSQSVASAKTLSYSQKQIQRIVKKGLVALWIFGIQKSGEGALSYEGKTFKLDRTTEHSDPQIYVRAACPYCVIHLYDGGQHAYGTERHIGGCKVRDCGEQVKKKNH